MFLEQISWIDAFTTNIYYFIDNELLIALTFIQQSCHLQSHLIATLITLMLLLLCISFGRNIVIVYLFKGQLCAFQISFSVLLIQTAFSLYLIGHSLYLIDDCIFFAVFLERLLLTLFFKHFILATNFGHQPTLQKLSLFVVIIERRMGEL